MDILIWNLFSESNFDFGKWSNWKYANTGICVYSVWPLLKVKNWFRMQISNEKVHITILNFFMESFDQYLKKSKMDFPVYFQIFNCGGQIHFLEIDPYIFRVLGPILAIKSAREPPKENSSSYLKSHITTPPYLGLLTGSANWVS